MPEYKIALAYQPSEFPADHTFSTSPPYEIPPFQRARWCTHRNIRRISESTRSPPDRNRPTPPVSLSGCSTFFRLSRNPVESTVSRPTRGIRFSCRPFPFTLLPCISWTASSALPPSNLSLATLPLSSPSSILKQLWPALNLAPASSPNPRRPQSPPAAA